MGTLQRIGCLFSTVLCFSAWAQCQSAWEPGLPDGSMDGIVNAMMSFDFDGAGPNPSELVVGGSLGPGAYGDHLVARFDGQFWRPVKRSATLLNGGSVINSMLSFNGQLTAGGFFTSIHGSPANSIATWNGTDWVGFGQGFLNAQVNALAVYNGELYAGGQFTASGSTPLARIAKWNGTSWVAVGSGLTSSQSPPNAQVMALATINGRLYAGGDFQLAGGVPATNLAVWNGTTWSALGDPNGIVQTLATYSNATAGSARLFIGGQFLSIAGMSASRTAVVRFDPINGNVWSTYNAPANLTSCDRLNVASTGVNTFQVNAVFRTGCCTGSLYRLMNNTWTLTSPPGADVRSAITRSGALLSGNDADGNVAVHSFDGTNWTPVGSAAYPRPIKSMSATPSGDFVATSSTNGSLGAQSLVRRRNAMTGAWSTVIDQPLSMFGEIVALSDSQFLIIDNRDSVRQVQSWNGSSLSNLGNIGNGTISALARMPNGDIIAAGRFDTASGVPALNVARWIGNVWTPIGNLGTASDLVEDVKVTSSGDLYACGRFLTASGLPATRVARWNGVIWVALGSGVDNEVYKIEELADGSVVFGGRFQSAGGVPARGIARWNGTAWSSLGTGVTDAGTNFYVNSLLTMPSGDLFAGGYFNTMGGQAVNHVARWDGSAWHALGQGIFANSGPFSNAVTSLAKAGPNSVAVGGIFPGPVGADSANFAIYTISPQPCCDSIDFNNDTSLFDPTDIDAFFSVFSEGPCIPTTATCNDLDFNNDGSLFDPCDIDSFMLVFSEGPCTLCGV
jgi:trimeric autotransporter adhesin